MPPLLLSPSQALFGLITQRPLFETGNRGRCVTRPNNVCERDYAYCRFLQQREIKIIRLQ